MSLTRSILRKVLDVQVQSVEDRTVYSNSVYGIEKKALPFLLCATNMLLHDIDNPRIIHGNSLEKNVREYKESDRFDVILMNPPYGGNEKEGVKQNFPADLRSSETADLFMSVIMYRLKQNGRCAIILPDGFLFGTDNAKMAIKEKLRRRAMNDCTATKKLHSPDGCSGQARPAGPER